MAAKTDPLLVVLSVLEGRHFPKCPRLNLVVQASFDGEQLATDPVEHREQPQFSTELAWELDRRTLHQHRLQRTPIKLLCLTLDPNSRRKESVGYLVLDLRSVQEVKQEPRWYPLLSSKYSKQRPALLLSAVLESDARPATPSPDRFKARKAPPRQGSPAVADLLPDRLEAVLVPEQGYHQVGPADHCCYMFVLSVTVAFATRLEQLVPTTSKLSALGSRFFFFYRLLGNDVTGEPFSDLLNPDFQPERASVRIRSSERVLLSFLSQQPPLQVHLCCGSRYLGSTDVSLSSLSSVAMDLDRKPATVEGAFVLRPPADAMSAPPLEPQPTVGVAVTLRREDVPLQSLASKERSGVAAKAVPPPPPPPASSPPPPSPPAEPPHRPPASSPHTESEAESILAELRPAESAPPAQTQVAPPLEVDLSSVSVSGPKVSIPASAHHFCFSLDLHGLRGVGLKTPIAAALRYSYPFFGSAAPIMTSPPVHLQRNMEASLPQSYCAFDFASLPQQLEDTFLRVPLVVELWNRDSNVKDQLMGRAVIKLSGLLSQERRRRPGAPGEQSWKQTLKDQVPVVRVHSPGQEMAELSFVATLEDLGLVKAREVVVSDFSQAEAAAPQRPSPDPAPPGPPPPPPPPAAPPDPRATAEYRAALELEMWKEEQEDLFDDQLKQKELNHMRALAEEWKRRDREREALAKKKEVEFSRLEEQLQKTLLDLERREKQLEEAALQTERLQRDLLAEHELRQKELQESTRRLQLDCDHRVVLEREKVRLMEEERGRLLQQLSDGESRYKELEKEFQRFREQQNVRPEVRLQSENNILTLEKVELERKLESTIKSKLHYKQQWGRALKELARFKQREQENAMTRLKKQQAELEAMRLRYLAAEEKQAVRLERQELDDIRNQMNRLKQQEERLGPAPIVSGPAPSFSGSAPSHTEGADEHLTRLLEERDTLLRTGVYSHDDRIIAELNRQIQETIAGPGTP